MMQSVFRFFCVLCELTLHDTGHPKRPQGKRQKGCLPCGLYSYNGRYTKWGENHGEEAGSRFAGDHGQAQRDQKDQMFRFRRDVVCGKVGIPFLCLAKHFLAFFLD